jgi:hypothetical protein
MTLLAVDVDEPQRGRAEALPGDPAPSESDRGGLGSAPPPPRDRDRHRDRRRPDRPPRWKRLLLMLVMVTFCFAVGYMIGEGFGRLEERLGWR